MKMLLSLEVDAKDSQEMVDRLNYFLEYAKPKENFGLDIGVANLDLDFLEEIVISTINSDDFDVSKELMEEYRGLLSSIRRLSH